MTDRQVEEQATSLDAPGLLAAAARLVDRALLKLDTAQAPCQVCGGALWKDRDHARVYEQLANIPDRLRKSVAQLQEGHGKPVRPSRGYEAAAAFMASLDAAEENQGR
jgi:hypothetical protein